MNFRLVSAFFMISGISFSAFATTYESRCNATLGELQEVEWEAALASENSQAIQSFHPVGQAIVRIEVIPGAAAFADVMKVNVSSEKSEFELMSLLSRTGYGSIVYSGPFDGQKLSLECVVNRIKE